MAKMPKFDAVKMMQNITFTFRIKRSHELKWRLRLASFIIKWVITVLLNSNVEFDAEEQENRG